MKNSTIFRVVLLGSLAIISIFVVQAYWLSKSYTLNEREFEQRVTSALTKVANDIALFNNSDLPSQNLIKKVTNEYYLVNINNFFQADNLEFFLQKEFIEFALNEDFEFGIYDCDTDRMVGGKYVTFSTKLIEEGPVVQELETDDDFLYYFGVRFPNRTRHIFREMALPIILSAILLVAIIFFIYSIYVILKQKRLSEMQKDFINNMTHEFKTPISTVNISSDVLLRNPTIQADTRLQQYASIIKEQNNRLNKQVEKVLQFARVEKKNFRLKLEEVDIHEILTNIAYSVQLRIDEAEGQFDFQLCDSQPIIQADRLHLTNILHNLLDNAVKYSKEKPVISLSTTKENGKLIIKIQDKGIGISPAYQKKVFKKFFRVPTGNIHDVKGFGLGLFYVKNICKQHGWPIHLESTLGAGTTFSIRIPIIKN